MNPSGRMGLIFLPPIYGEDNTKINYMENKKKQTNKPKQASEQNPN